MEVLQPFLDMVTLIPQLGDLLGLPVVNDVLILGNVYSQGDFRYRFCHNGLRGSYSVKPGNHRRKLENIWLVVQLDS